MLIEDFDIIVPYRLGMKFRDAKQGKKQYYVGYKRRVWDASMPTKILKGSIGKDYDKVMQKLRPHFRTYESYHWFYNHNLGTAEKHGKYSFYGIYKDEDGIIRKRTRKVNRFSRKLTIDQKRKYKRKLKAERKHTKYVNAVLQSLINNLPVLRYYSRRVRELKALKYSIFSFKSTTSLNKFWSRYELKKHKRDLKRILEVKQTIKNIENGDYSDVYKDLIHMSKFYVKPCHHF